MMATTLEIAKQHKKITAALKVIAKQLAIRKKKSKKAKRGKKRL